MGDGRRKGLRGSPIKVTRDLRPGVSPSATQPPLPVALRAFPAQFVPAAGLGRVGPALIHAAGALAARAGGAGRREDARQQHHSRHHQRHENDPHFKWHTGLSAQAPPVPRPASIGSRPPPSVPSRHLYVAAALTTWPSW